MNTDGAPGNKLHVDADKIMQLSAATEQAEEFVDQNADTWLTQKDLEKIKDFVLNVPDYIQTSGIFSKLRDDAEDILDEIHGFYKYAKKSEQDKWTIVQSTKNKVEKTIKLYIPKINLGLSYMKFDNTPERSIETEKLKIQVDTLNETLDESLNSKNILDLYQTMSNMVKSVRAVDAAAFGILTVRARDLEKLYHLADSEHEARFKYEQYYDGLGRIKQRKNLAKNEKDLKGIPFGDLIAAAWYNLRKQ